MDTSWGVGGGGSGRAAYVTIVHPAITIVHHTLGTVGGVATVVPRSSRGDEGDEDSLPYLVRGEEDSLPCPFLVLAAKGTMLAIRCAL